MLIADDLKNTVSVGLILEPRLGKHLHPHTTLDTTNVQSPHTRALHEAASIWAAMRIWQVSFAGYMHPPP
jgi:hypothetical protein